jgi:hypothetical protein
MSDGNGDRIPLAIGVTSHRNIPVSQVAAIRGRLREFFARLDRDYPDLPLTVVSALAQGSDQLVAEEALAAGARLVAVLPMDRAQYAEDFLDAAEHARFDALCARAEVIELPRVAGNSLDDADAAPIGAERDRHYAQAGVYIKVELSASGGPDPAWAKPVHAYFLRQQNGWRLVGFERIPEG